HFLGIKRELFERKNETPVLGMPFNVCIELGGEKVAFDHVAFELRHVDAVCRKSAERLVQGCGHIAYAEQERRDHRTLFLPRPFGFAREHDESRRVVVLILDVLSADIEPIDLGGKARCYRRPPRVRCLRHLARRARSIGGDYRLEPKLADDLWALSKCVDGTLFRFALLPPCSLSPP